MRKPGIGLPLPGGHEREIESRNPSLGWCHPFVVLKNCNGHCCLQWKTLNGSFAESAQRICSIGNNLRRVPLSALCGRCVIQSARDGLRVGSFVRDRTMQSWPSRASPIPTGHSPVGRRAAHTTRRPLPFHRRGTAQGCWRRTSSRSGAAGRCGAVLSATRVPVIPFPMLETRVSRVRNHSMAHARLLSSLKRPSSRLNVSLLYRRTFLFPQALVFSNDLRSQEEHDACNLEAEERHDGGGKRSIDDADE
jgi:hypothetical protein